MNPILRNILAIIAGFIVGSVINSGLVNVGPSIIPLPEGADISTMEGLAASMKLFEPIHFLFPYLGHAIGTLAGAYTAARLGASHHMWLALGIGFIFLAGGMYAIKLFGGPTWFKAVDLLSYIPMGFLGGKMALSTLRKKHFQQ